MGETDPERLSQLLRITDNIIFLMNQFPPPFVDAVISALSIRAYILYQLGKVEECYKTLQNIFERLSKLVLQFLTLTDTFALLIILCDRLKNEEMTRKVLFFIFYRNELKSFFLTNLD